MKKRFIFLILLCLMLFVSALPSQALRLEDNARGVVKPLFTYISIFESVFVITPGGRADVDAFVYAPPAEETAVSAYLQQYKNGSWQTIKSWSNREEGDCCGMGNSWYVNKGYSYRVVSYGYVYINGVMVESTSITSQTRSY